MPKSSHELRSEGAPKMGPQLFLARVSHLLVDPFSYSKFEFSCLLLVDPFTDSCIIAYHRAKPGADS